MICLVNNTNRPVCFAIFHKLSTFITTNISFHTLYAIMGFTCAQFNWDSLAQHRIFDPLNKNNIIMKNLISKKIIIILSAVFFFSVMKTEAQSTAKPGGMASLRINADTVNIKKRIISFAFFAPMNSHLEFDYEQVIKNKISFVGALGIIGPGIDLEQVNPGGVYFKAGTKFYFSPDYMLNGMYRYNNLQGAYFKPEIIISAFSSSPSAIFYDSSPDRSSTAAIAFMLNYGKQWVIQNSVSFDWHIGIGYGASSSDVGNSYSHVGGVQDIPMAYSVGLTIGFLSK